MACRGRLLAGLGSSLMISCAFIAPVLAQDAQSDAIVLQPVTLVGGTKPATATTAETPLTTRVTREELDAAQIEDADDIGRLDPAISFSEGSQSFNIRGLDRSRTLTTIDGIRVPWIEDGARGVTGGVSAFDFDTLSTLDIVKGADSSIYGAGALGGVVNLRTLNPEDLLPGNKTFGGLSKGSFDSKDQSWSVDQAIAARIDQTFMLLQGGYRDGREIENQGDIGGIGPTRSEKLPLDYDNTNVLAKIRQHVEGGHVIGITGESYDRDDDIEALTESSATYDYTARTPTRDKSNKRERLSANYEYAPEETDGTIKAAEAIIYWQRQSIDDDFSAYRLSTPAGDYRRNSQREETTYGINGSLLAGFDTGSISHGVSIGGEIFGSEASQFSSGEDTCPAPPYPPRFFTCNFLHTNQADMPETDGATVGLFIQDEIALLDSKVRVTPGLRYDWYRQTPQETDGFLANATYTGLPEESSDSALSPKLRAEWDAADAVTLFAQWAQGFRAPTATELYLSYGGPGTYLSLGNASLEPETSNGFEIGAKLGDETFGGSVNAFYNRYENFIDTVSVSPASVGLPAGLYPFGITGYVNRANVEIYGAEASAHFRLESGWHASASLAAYVGRDRDTDEHLNSIPAVKGILGLGYATDIYGADVILTAAAKRDKAENDLSKTPAYGIVDVTGWWAPDQLAGAKVKAGVYNLFDETYYDALDIPDSTTLPKEYFTEAGRTFKATVSFQF
ncbi:TonB-dependent receptor [Aureimonas sp. SA4125]|uniref:TonB-dependent hemoglobin/transferrin/lactoferrin family receptor n=1 Tax=Aureimonas sp. SA4125 TaxID=2826993 RepID=UPI001CC492E9|nr:TonB-dependent hemoglobin/transferrin/lactoferrin family receptor [Aureimonas sp. SA4125]BDA85695.1 TonB-dependent receptor [Aureimonas sp. SA4125]